MILRLLKRKSTKCLLPSNSGCQMKITVKNAPLLILISMVFSLLPSAVHADGALDGKVFEVVLDGEQDTLTFQDGTFHSSSCDQYGFSKGAYMTSGEGGNISFEATTTSEKNGTLVWTGDVREGSIRGSQLWTKEGYFGTTKTTKQFEGSMRK